MQTQVGTYPEMGSASRSFKFIMGSSFLHIILFAVALVSTLFISKPEKPALMEISILDSSSSAVPLAKAARQALPAPAAAAEPKSEAPVVDKDAVAVPAPKIAQAKILQKVSAPKVAAVKPTIVEAPAPELNTEDLDQELQSDVAIPAAHQLTEKDIADDLDKVDNEQAEKIQALKKSADQEAAGALAEQEQNLKAAQAETNAQADALAQQAAAVKAADRTRIQNAQAAEQQAAAKAQAAADKAARDQAAAESSAAQTAAAQKVAAAKYADEMAYGRSLGVDAPVKALSDIRQAPGNKKPTYESEDRLSGRQGEVSFLAFISKDGQVTDVKLLKSTGHRSLDAKTLAAIRSWKFYPGQSGWVEIPFKWDLKGGPQEMPATLRRSVSQRE
jgi:TonB family protein